MVWKSPFECYIFANTTKRKTNMSIIKIDVTEDHLKLIRNLSFFKNGEHFTTQNEDNDIPNAFGNNDRYFDMGVILFGKPHDFDVTKLELTEYSDEQKEYMDKLWNDLEHVLELRCNMDNLTPGTYKRKYHQPGDWRKL